jgi:hypothetical protein
MKNKGSTMLPLKTTFVSVAKPAGVAEAVTPAFANLTYLGSLAGSVLRVTRS